MTDQEVIQKLKAKFGQVKKGNGNWIRVRCPTCDPHHAAKMRRGINLQTLVTNCFICCKPLSLTQIFGEEDFSNRPPVVITREEHPQAKELPYDFCVPVSALPEDHPAIKFLKKDHFSDFTDLYIKYGVGFVLKEDAKPILFTRPDSTGYAMTVAESLVFPVYFEGELVGWQARFIPGTSTGDRTKLKYLHLYNKGKYLYNYDNAKKYDTVVVVEGIKKAWKFPNAVATLGKGISENQIQLLEHWDKIIFMYDGEDATQKIVRNLEESLERRKQVVCVDPRDYGYPSPDEMTAEEAEMITYIEWVKKYGNS